MGVAAARTCVDEQVVENVGGGREVEGRGEGPATFEALDLQIDRWVG